MRNEYLELELSELYAIRVQIEQAIENSLEKGDKLYLRYIFLHYIKKLYDF